jgi:hypothetical protein
MQPSIVSTGSETELAAIAVAAVVICMVMALWARTRAPAVTVALVTALVTGVLTVWIASADGPRGVPLVALVSASAAMAASGFVSLWLLPKTGLESLRRVALVTFVAAPLLGIAALVSIQQACPLYVTRGAGACYYSEDLLGGWSAAAAVVITLDVVLIAVLLLLSSRRPSVPESAAWVAADDLRL